MWQNLVFDFSGYEVKHLLNVDIFLGTDFEKLQAELFCHLLSFLEGHFSLCTVTFVAHNDFYYIVAGVNFDLSKPIIEGLKGGKVSDWIGEDDSHWAPIISLGDGFEFFLTGSVPDLESYAFAVDVDGFDLEVDALMRDGVPMVDRCEVMKLF